MVWMTAPMHLLAITPGTGFDPSSWGRILDGGVDAFMLREPGLEAAALFAAAIWCRRLRPDLRLWVNGRLDVALAAECGLHAPEAYPEVPGGIASLSRPLHAEAQFPGRQEAAQLLVAPLFPVPGKGAPWGVPRLHAFLDTCPAEGPRMLALGGITPDHLRLLAHPRLGGVALIRALWEAPNPEALVRQLRGAWCGGSR